MVDRYGLMLSYFIILVLSHTTTYRREHPYTRLNYRPRGEPVLVFCRVQLIFYSVLCFIGQALLPVRGSSIWELDQAGSLLCTVMVQLYCRGETFKIILGRFWNFSAREFQTLNTLYDHVRLGFRIQMGGLPNGWVQNFTAARNYQTSGHGGAQGVVDKDKDVELGHGIS
ncbi:hypothetical protein QBC38DRAFT_250948 [Podospora fimiseda]|uniref:Uncharacterized protein n=1 Tax=Podospora fimiseda TaxID=252190 RepID=A0AAN7BM55_9PEZI|nr:hypothetical protein QBC38DRAFT_250948 [Podospora fimiseda]